MEAGSDNAQGTLEKVNRILGISESYDAPRRLMEVIFDERKRKGVFLGFLKEFQYDLTHEWFYEYFEDEHADRKNRGQDFTPESISKVIASLTWRRKESVKIVEDPAAGCGSTIIQHWGKAISGMPPWEFRPDDYLYVLTEKTSKTIPFLLTNLMIRGMNAIVIHGDSLTREAEDVYWVYNEENQLMCFSNIFRAEHSERIADMFGIRWMDKEEGRR